MVPFSFVMAFLLCYMMQKKYAAFYKRQKMKREAKFSQASSYACLTLALISVLFGLI